MGFNLSVSWFIVLIAFLVECYLVYKSPSTAPGPNYPRLQYIAWALFFLSILVTGVINMHTSGAH
jgi:hypothetical protein